MSRHLPFTVKIELVRGCTRRCPFCALPYMEWVKESWRFMPDSIFRYIIDDMVGWRDKCRVEFAERGEPSLHPDIIDYIKYARKRLPKIQMMMTSNGDMIYKLGEEEFVDLVREMFAAGLNILMLDCYSIRRYERMKRLFPESKLFFEDGIHPYSYRGPNFEQIILVCEVVGRARDRIRVLQNMGGSVDVKVAMDAGYIVTDVNESLSKMCVRPFREIVIHYDGTVPLCCNDWKEEGVIGNVKDNYLYELWDKLDYARRLLLKKDRASLMPCAVCSERVGFRVGLEMGWFDG